MNDNLENACRGILQKDEMPDGPPQGIPFWRKLLRVCGWLIGGVALYAFLEYFEWAAFRRNVIRADLWMLAGAAGAYIAGLFVRAVRWTYMVRCHQSLSWIQGYHVIMVSNAANFFFPVRLGEIIKLVIVKRSFGVAYCSSTAASIIEKLTFLLIIVVFLGLAPFAGYHFSDWSSKYFPFLGVLLFISTLFLILGAEAMEWNKRFLVKLAQHLGIGEERLARFLSGSLMGYIQETMRQCHISSYSGRRSFWIGGLGLITLLLDGLANYFLLGAFGLPLTYLQAVVAACFFNVLFLLPSPPVQVGTAEMYPVLIYTVGLNLPGTGAATSALVWHLLSVVMVALFGLISLYAVGLRPGTMADIVRNRGNGSEDLQ